MCAINASTSTKECPALQRREMICENFLAWKGWGKRMGERCENYCGVACVNGSCPIASRFDYGERICDTIDYCEDCFYYKGCEDCYFDGNEDYCPRKGVDDNG